MASSSSESRLENFSLRTHYSKVQYELKVEKGGKMKKSSPHTFFKGLQKFRGLLNDVGAVIWRFMYSALCDSARNV